MVQARATFAIRRNPQSPSGYQLLRDGIPLDDIRPPQALLAALDTAITAAAVMALDRHYILVHAGAVAYADQGVLLPAPAGHGKSTLVAGLLAAGFQYLSDEVAVFDPHTHHLLPFAKSLAIKHGGAAALAELYPGLASGVPRLHDGREEVWYLPPPTRAWPAGPVPLRYVIQPEYAPATPTRLVSMRRTDGLAGVVQQACRLPAHGAAGFGSLVAAVRETECYALTVGELGSAIDHLLRLLDG
ncbi:MAG: hypothetical protein JOZ81_04385 [Chloroflexi bacterium]|nr:hypothetical protein [Chloroflexota bacterium]